MNIEKLFEMSVKEMGELSQSLKGAIAAWSLNEKQANRFGPRVTESFDFCRESNSIIGGGLGLSYALRDFDVSRYFNFAVFYDFDYSTSDANSSIQIQAISSRGNWVTLDSQSLSNGSGTLNKVIRFDGPYRSIRILLNKPSGSGAAIITIRSICMDASYVS